MKFYANLDITNMPDNKSFWENLKPVLSDKGLGKSELTLSKEIELPLDNGVSSLGICEPMGGTGVTAPIDCIIQKYFNHPGIININNNVFESNFSFLEITMIDIENEHSHLTLIGHVCLTSYLLKHKENCSICSLPSQILLIMIRKLSLAMD